MLRKVIFWLHLVAGLSSGLVAFILCLTGAILAFELQFIDRAERLPQARPPAADTPQQSPTAIVTAVAKSTPVKVTSLEYFSERAMPVRASLADRSTLLLNAYTGELLGPGAVRLREFFKWNTALHTNLTTGPAGHWVIAVANACFVFLTVSGLVLWWPRQWRWKAVRAVIVPRLEGGAKAREWNWHNVFGFWFLLPLFLIAATGLVLSFQAVNLWWGTFASEHLLAPPAVVSKPAASSPPSPATSWAQQLAVVQRQYPGWRSITLNPANLANKEGLLSFSVNFGTRRHPLATRQVKLDLKTSEIVEEKTWYSNEGKARARSIARLGHSGEILGFWGQVVGFLACVAGLLLVYTGSALSFRRFFGRKAKVQPATS